MDKHYFRYEGFGMRMEKGIEKFMLVCYIK